MSRPCGRLQVLNWLVFQIGIRSPMSRHPLVYALSVRAFMGLPCPKKIAGNVSAMRAPPGSELVSISDRHTFPDEPPSPGVRVVREGVHGVAVSEEDRGQCLGHAGASRF